MNKYLDLTTILKDCPKGTEFYSRCLGVVKFESINDALKCIIVKNQRETVYYKENGVYYYADENAEIDLFPSKDQRDWSKWHIPFKDGDILASKNGYFIGIIKVKNNVGFETYCAINDIGSLTINTPYYFERFATEKEKKRLFDAIELNGYKWNEETKNLEKLVTIFKIGDKIKLKNEYTKKYNDFNIREITEIKHSHYILDDEQAMPLSNQYLYELVANESYPKSLKHFDNMTRQEEIEQQTFVYYETCSDEDIAKSKGFIDGAEWADKTMIEKACKIAKDILSSYSFVNYPHEMQDFLVDFRKAMEGENMSSYVKKFHIIYDGNDGRTYDEYIYCKYNNGCDVQNWCSEDGSPLDFESVTDSQAYVRSCCIANIPIDLVWKDNKCFYWEEIKEFTLPKSVIKTFKDK